MATGPLHSSLSFYNLIWLLLDFFFLCGPFLKSLLICYNIASVLYFDFGMWQSGIEPAPPASEGKVLTSGLPGKSLVTARFVGSWLFAGSAKIS